MGISDDVSLICLRSRGKSIPCSANGVEEGSRKKDRSREDRGNYIYRR